MPGGNTIGWAKYFPTSRAPSTVMVSSPPVEVRNPGSDPNTFGSYVPRGMAKLFPTRGDAPPGPVITNEA
jgi:hypothetical protein